MTVTKTAPKDRLRHEEFCLPRPGADAPRIESYPGLVDDVTTGRSKPVVTVTRCVECGATTYDPKEK